jgi:hypothetical protein
MTLDELRENVYEIRALLHIYEQALSKHVPEPESYVANNELKVTKDELLKLLVLARRRVNELGR